MDQPVLFKLQLPAEHRYLNVVSACAAAILERQPDLVEPQILIYNVQLALQEVCANIIDHAYQEQPGQVINIAFELQAAPARLVVTLRDTGCSFNPETVALPNLDDIAEGGYGLFLIQQLMDDIAYTALPEGNHWQLVKNL